MPIIQAPSAVPGVLIVFRLSESANVVTAGCLLKMIYLYTWIIIHFPNWTEHLGHGSSNYLLLIETHMH